MGRLIGPAGATTRVGAEVGFDARVAGADVVSGIAVAAVCPAGRGVSFDMGAAAPVAVMLGWGLGLSAAAGVALCVPPLPQPVSTSTNSPATR